MFDGWSNDEEASGNLKTKKWSLKSDTGPGVRLKKPLKTQRPIKGADGVTQAQKRR